MVGDDAADQEFTGEEPVQEEDVAQRLLSAYSKFVEAEPFTLRRIYRTLPLATCQDIVQEAYLKVGRKAAAGELRADTDVMAYLCRTARNLAIDQFRQQQSAKERLLEDPAGMDSVPLPREPADDDVEAMELVAREIERMPLGQRRQVVDLQSKGLSDAEIAAALGIPARRIHNLRNKAIAYLRRKLTEHIRDGHRRKLRARKDR
ncbi:RNA polymerase sigma factor [Streptomyces sp. NBC_00648]|uniref:RNA polymerase sigma factor n=1 Tax=Streptomyces sp. NBC_00648 TaxID=2975797 RepID=UPI00325478C2